MSLIDGELLIQKLREYIDSHGIYRHTYERMGIENIINDMMSEKSSESGEISDTQYDTIHLLRAKEQYKQELKKTQENLAILRMELAAREEQLRKIQNTNSSNQPDTPIVTYKTAHWKRDYRYRLFDSPNFGLQYKKLTHLVCSNCGTQMILSDEDGIPQTCKSCHSFMAGIRDI